MRGQLTEFCGRNRRPRRRYCIPGAKVNDIIEAADCVTERATPDTLYMIYAGTNDVQTTKPDDLVAKYRRVIHKYKEKSQHVLVSGILPRIKPYFGFFKRAHRNNGKLRKMCEDEGMAFTNLCNHFYECENLFRDDGPHLNETGSARLGRLLDGAGPTY